METGDCPFCGGSGWVTEVSASGAAAKRCACFEERRTRTLLLRSNIPPRYKDCTFENFKPMTSLQADALKNARLFVDDFPDRNVGLLFIGPCGVGKTHLAAAILSALIQKSGTTCLFYDFRDLLRDIQATYTPDTGVSESEVLEPVFESRVLLLDELGAKRSSAWVEETVFYIINQRYNLKKLTLFTSNYPDTPEEAEAPVPWKKTDLTKREDDTLVDRIGIRLRSRIYEMCKIVEMDGKDFRQTIRQGNYRSGRGF